MSVRGDYLVDTSATGSGMSFATYWPGLGFRPLAGTELLSTLTNSTVVNANLGPVGTQAFGTAAAATVTLGSGAGLAGYGAGQHHLRLRLRASGAARQLRGSRAGF
jgi:hypothetical protein